MALSSVAYYSNAIVGSPQQGGDVNIYEANTNPKFPVGYGFKRADGNVFRYCHVGTATRAGNLVGPTTASGGATYNAVALVGSTASVAVPGESNIKAGQSGSHFVEATVAAIAKDKYRGSYLITTQGTGMGHTYRIKGNTATDDPASGNIRIQLYDAITSGMNIYTGTIIVPSMYTDLTVTAISSSQVTGVLMADTSSTKIYGWVCTHGVSGCCEDGTNTVTAGYQVSVSTVTAGAYACLYRSGGTVLASSVAVPIIGYSITPSAAGAASNRSGAIYLTLE